MYEGWANFAGEEIFNADRLAAYINAGLFPDGAVINACDECGTLARGLGQPEYRSPVLDQASWVDTLNPDTYGFAGVMPLEITGVNGSTRTAEVVEFAGDGGVVRKPRYGTRTVAVTALLVGKTTASVEAGLTWLSTVLSGGSGCAPGCLGDDLCFLSYCPDLDEIEDMTQASTPTPIPYIAFDPYDGTLEAGGIFRPYHDVPAGTTLTNLVTAPLGPTATTVQGWTSDLGAAPITPAAGGGATITFPAALDASLLSSPQMAAGGTTIALQADITMSVAGRRTLQIAWVNAAGVVFDAASNVSVSVAAGVTATQHVTGTPPVGAVGFRVQVQTPDAVSAGETLSVARVMAQKLSITGGFFDGDTPDNGKYVFAWTGAAGGSTSTRTAVAHDYTARLVLTTPIPCYTDAQFGITVGSVSGPVSWHLDFTDKETGELLHRSATRTTNGTQTYKLSIPSDWSDWIVTVYPHDEKPLQISNIYVSHRPVSNPRSCFDDATITYGNSVCVSGPTVTDKMGFACGETLYKVEWTWVSGNPFAQGRTTGLVTNMNLTTGAAARKAYEVVTRNPRDVAYTNTVCKPKIDTYRPGLTDPCCSGWVLPPSAPALVDDCFDPPTSFARTEMWIPPRYAPGNGWGALTITITNDSRMKRGLRMRVYPDPLNRGIDFLGAVTPSKQECAFCEEWWFTYISADSDTVIDGVHSRIYTRKTGYQDINSAANVRGRNGGPFGFPTIDCNAGYLLVVDLPKTYPFDCGQYDKGDSQGNAVVDVAITTMGL